MADREDDQRKNTMLNGCNEDTRWREKMLGGNNGLWTIECLRGRLLAERAASKAAKQDAELLGKKLIELEQKLKLEIKLKNKAEKKLKYLIGKLDSLKLSRIPVNSSSVNNEDCSSTSTASSGVTEQLEQSSEKSVSEDQRKSDTKTNDVATAGSSTASISSRTGVDQPYDDNEEISSKASDDIHSKCYLILRETPTTKTVSKACQLGTPKESSKIPNSHSFLYSASAY